MTDREQFEAWWKIHEYHTQFEQINTDEAWAVWQAARAAPSVEAKPFQFCDCGACEDASRAAPAQPEPITGPNYDAGLWSRRNYEAWLEDQQGTAQAQPAEPD
jgi:hypothetical protein